MFLVVLLLSCFVFGRVSSTPDDQSSDSEPQYIPTDKVCDTRNTTDGRCCVFPFTYRGEIYYECTKSDYEMEWCSLTKDYDTDQLWAICANDTRKSVFDTILAATGETAKFRDGIYLFQGDIIMTQGIRENLRLRGILVPGDDPTRRFRQGWGKEPQKRHKRAVMKTDGLRWMSSSGRPEIPYEITRSNLNVQSVIKRAMNHWMENVRCLRFVPRKSHHRRHLSFFSGGGCYSMVGRQPGTGAQRISIGNGCGYLGVVVHEIGHALGFWHEQSRPDRDTYVTINWRNIQRGMAYNFHKYGTDRINSRGVSYDYDSVMHYSSTAFANRAGVRTIVGKNGRTNLGQRYGLSRKDIQQANLLYCGAQPPVTNSPRPPTPPPPTGCNYSDKHHYCPFWKSRGHCQIGSRHNHYMKSNCKKSCLCKPDTTCADMKNDCGAWSRQGFCSSFEDFMNVYCRKSCRKC